MVCFTKLKKLWDELAHLNPFPICNYRASKELMEMEDNDKLRQFLMGLNNAYNHRKNQLLLMDPLPLVNKAYSMILCLEK